MKGDAFLVQKQLLNYRLLDWLCSIIKDLIEDTIEDEPDTMKTFIAINNMLNELSNDVLDVDIEKLVSEELTRKIFDEIRNCI